MSRDDTDPDLAAVARRFAQWECWRGPSGLCYARRAGTRQEPVVGEDPQDLADVILRAEREDWRS